MKKGTVFLLIFFSIGAYNLFPQAYSSVPVENTIYQILDLAAQRGLCAPLSGSRPYTRARVFAVINEILAAETEGRGKLSAGERQILEQEKEKYGEYEKGLSLKRGAYFNATTILKTDVKFSANIGLSADAQFSQGINTTKPDYNWGGDFWISAYINGDIGNHVSYNVIASGALLRAPRELLGFYHTYYPGFSDHDEYIDRLLPTYSDPLAYFPFSYRKKWDGSVFYIDSLDSSGFQTWPEHFSGAYALNSELSAAFWSDSLFFRLGRIGREWGAMSPGSSLILNSSARPFLGLEAQFQPVSWFNFSTLLGELEYYNQAGIKISAMANQNAYSITMLEANIKKFLHIDFGEAVVFPKRFELGYASPLTDSFFYQNNIGDFDNLMIFLNIKGNIPGIMSLWFSFYDDETELRSDMALLDRSMTALQGGATINIPVLPFASVKLTYTKIEPYTYTHNRGYVPWYNEQGGPMETAYMNNGVGLGYYLPPNSDELLLRFETMAGLASKIHFQYQMIRHGADYGESAVDGSSYLSELDPENRNTNPILKKYFLHDGAYQWFHIVKAGGERTFNKLPFKLYGEAGVVFSYFTNIDGSANQGNSSPYSVIDTAEYPKATNFVLTLGVKIFPD